MDYRFSSLTFDALMRTDKVNRRKGISTLWLRCVVENLLNEFLGAVFDRVEPVAL